MLPTNDYQISLSQQWSQLLKITTEPNRRKIYLTYYGIIR